MYKVMCLSIVLLSLSGCGYAICRSFGNTPEQCAYECTYEAERDAEGNTIPNPSLQYPNDYKVKKTCTYSLRNVLWP